MRSKIWSEVILFVSLCLIPNYSVVCINFEEDDERVGMNPLGAVDDPFGFFGDLMPPNFAPLGGRNDDNFDDIGRYNKGKADNDNEEDFHSYIGNVYNSNPKAKNMFDVLNSDDSSSEQKFDDIDYDVDDDDDEVNRNKVKHPSMKFIRRISPSWDKSNASDWDDRIIGKSASMKDSISRLIGIGHKSSTASSDEADGKSKKDGDSNDDDDDDDDDDSDGESDQKTTKMDGKSKGNLFSKLFSKSKTTSSDKATTEAYKLTTKKLLASNLTAASDEEDDDEDEDESSYNSTSSSRTSTIKKSSESGSTIVTPLSSSTTASTSTSTTSTTKKGKSHKHKEASSTSTTPAPDDIPSTEKVTKKHHQSHNSTLTMPSTTLVHESSHKHSKNTKDTEVDDDDENKTDHKSTLDIIEAFLAGLGHESNHAKDNHTSTEAPVPKSTKHSKTHKKKHGKSKHKKSTTVIPESISTALEETGSNSSSTTAKPENKSEFSTTIRPKGDTTTAISTSTTDFGASFPVISITRTTSKEKYQTIDSSTAESHASSNSHGSSTTSVPTLGPYVEDSDDILVTNESIVYSDWNPDVFP